MKDTCISNYIALYCVIRYSFPRALGQGVGLRGEERVETGEAYHRLVGPIPVAYEPILYEPTICHIIERATYSTYIYPKHICHSKYL